MLLFVFMHTHAHTHTHIYIHTYVCLLMFWKGRDLCMHISISAFVSQIYFKSYLVKSIYSEHSLATRFFPHEGLSAGFLNSAFWFEGKHATITSILGKGNGTSEPLVWFRVRNKFRLQPSNFYWAFQELSLLDSKSRGIRTSSCRTNIQNPILGGSSHLVSGL